MKPLGRIYIVTNSVNGKVYIGQTRHESVSRRFHEHCSEANCRSDIKRRFLNALRKHGREKFSIKELAGGYNVEQLNILEVFYIQFFDATNPEKGYNIQLGGKNGAKRVQISEETRQRLRDSHKGKKPSEETRAKMRAAHTGRIVSAETRAKLSKAHTGRKITWEPAKPWLGVKMSEERKALLKIGRSGAESPSAKKIYQYDKNLNLINSWPAKVLAEKETGLKAISGSLKKPFYRACGGFYWSYKTKEEFYGEQNIDK